MKLERTLIELEMLVDYGTRYLLDVNSAYEDGVECGRDMVADLSIWEFCDLNGLSNDDILDSMDSDDIANWVRIHLSIGKINFDGDEIVEYCRDNFALEDIYDEDDIKDTLLSNYEIDDFYDDYHIQEYVHNHFDADETYDADEMLDCVTIGDIKECIKRNGWENEFCMDQKDAKDILNGINPKDLYDYVTENFALADWVEWRDECLSFEN